MQEIFSGTLPSGLKPRIAVFPLWVLLKVNNKFTLLFNLSTHKTTELHVLGKVLLQSVVLVENDGIGNLLETF